MVVEVIDPSGAVKKTYNLDKEDQRSNTTLNIGDLAAGGYWARITNGRMERECKSS